MAKKQQLEKTGHTLYTEVDCVLQKTSLCSTQQIMHTILKTPYLLETKVKRDMNMLLELHHGVLRISCK